jgi:UDP-N-acetylglucosamine--N-acetylmuramyl-(pentapeptide) pyrophosphoryl-undecaprenol N-acetylglucosamine transferase
VGGSQGALAVNDALLGALENAVRSGARPEGLELLWSTGPAHHAAIVARLEALGVREWVHAVGYIDDMPRALAAADAALSRAGAMATAELLAWHVPMLLVPLPTAAADHQRHNARALEAAGAALVIEPTELDAERLWSALTSVVRDVALRARMAAAAAARAQPDAARNIAAQLERLLEAA